MNELKTLKEITKNCVVLAVDDDELVLDFLRDALQGLFKEVLTAFDGQEGLQKFKTHRLDIIITDQIMPKLTGIDLIKEVRRIDPKFPIIMMTAYPETTLMLEAINLGVTQFLVKPVKVSNLINAIEMAMQRVVLERQKQLSQEAELLRIREEYNLLQQRLTLQKQQNIIRNDLYYKRFDVTGSSADHNGWLINIRYKPQEILSGDFYSIRKIDDHRVLLYLADAMGKGLNAFVTSSIVTSFVNYAIDKALTNGHLHLKGLLNDVVDYTKRLLDRDEALCALFVLLDLKDEVAEIANFAMPPVLCDISDGEIFKIVSNNLPIMRQMEDFKIERLSLEGLNKLIMMSDGFFDPSYQERLEEAFSSASFKSHLLRSLQDVLQRQEDDATVIFVKRIGCVPRLIKTFTINSRLEEVQGLTAEVEQLLSDQQMDMLFIAETINALSELLMNAYEHGSLNITYLQKNRIIKAGNYEEYLLEAERSVNKKIRLTLETFKERENSFLCLRVTDEGEGFDTAIIKETIQDLELLHYRGIKIVRGLVDEIYYNEKGNEVIAIKGYREAAGISQ